MPKLTPEFEQRLRVASGSLFATVEGTSAHERSAMLCEVDRLRAALSAIAAIANRTEGGDWDEIEDARAIASAALKQQGE